MINFYIERHEAFLQKILDETSVPAKKIHSAVQYSLFPGGKRLRPLFVYLAGELLSTELAVLDVIAAAIEFTHCYSLIHDDLPAMDNDDFRRGKLSCHKAYDEATAILVGDGLQALAVDILLSGLVKLLSSDQVIKITQILVKASGIHGMVSGQSLDLSELAKSTLSEEQLKEIHLLKTGKLMNACFEMVINTQENVAHQAKETLLFYAARIGLVFQMQDDYLDYYAPLDALGKNRASDQANNKTTFATLLNKSQLEDEINLHYQAAIESLSYFGEKATNLIDLTRQLQKRNSLSSK